MDQPFPLPIAQALIERRRLQPGCHFELVAGGNTDRRDRATAIWRVTTPEGQFLKLTIGPNLAARAAAQAAFAADCPTLVPPPRFLESHAGSDLLGEDWFCGQPLSLLPATQSGDPIIRSTMTEVAQALHATAKASTEPARQAEWAGWTQSLLADCSWTEPEARHLQLEILPALYQLLCPQPPQTCWSNRDLTTSNILVAEDGGIRLIDLEYAARTHFYVEDAVRCHTLSPTARLRPDLFAALPLPAPSWHLYFWLRQYHLEIRSNTNTYLARVKPERLRVIRRLAEFVAKAPLTPWSESAALLSHHLESARWAQTDGSTLSFQGWCHVPATELRAVGIATADRWLAWTPLLPRPDVATHFAQADHALRSGFQLEAKPVEPAEDVLLCAHTASGELLPFARYSAGFLPGRGPAFHSYPQWCQKQDPDPPLVSVSNGPLISVLLPVYRTPLHFLTECLDSVRAQHYQNWELVVVDDGSQDAALSAALRQAAASDDRIKIRARPHNRGIARATNDALAAATGEFVLFLDHDDRLRPHTLSTIAARFDQEPTLDVIYTDEDKITATGERVYPIFKPAFSPELLRGVMYVGHALCVRTTIARSCGGLDSAYDGIQDFEFLLRLSEHTRRIGHIPRILYHWRISPGSIAQHGDAKGNLDTLQAAAVAAHLKRIGDPRSVRPLGAHRLRLFAEHSTIPFETVHSTNRDCVMTALRRAANARSTEVLITQLPELTPLTPSEAQELVSLAVQPEVGCVAPVLLSNEGLVLESGRVRHAQGTSPAMSGLDAAGDGYNGSLVCNREVAAVSSACVAVHRSLLALSDANSWDEFLRALTAQGRRHLVCAGVRARTNWSWRQAREHHAGPGIDPWWNAHFAADRADYRFAQGDQPSIF